MRSSITVAAAALIRFAAAYTKPTTLGGANFNPTSHPAMAEILPEGTPFQVTWEESGQRSSLFGFGQFFHHRDAYTSI